MPVDASVNLRLEFRKSQATCEATGASYPVARRGCWASRETVLTLPTACHRGEIGQRWRIGRNA